MATTEQVPATYEQAVRTLARWQGESGESDLEIYSFPDPEKQVVRLLHVSDAFSDRGGVHIYKMGKSEEFPFKSAIALSVPKYWSSIQDGDPLLPKEWNPGTFERVWPDERV